MSQLDSSFAQFTQPYYTKSNGSQFEPDSEDPGSVHIPASDFEPYYSDLASYDSEIDNNFLYVQDLNVPEGLASEHIKPYTQFAQELSSEPPTMIFNEDLTVGPRFMPDDASDLPSSPPSSPPRSPIRSPVRSPVRPRNRTQHLDSLGISHPLGHRPQSSISRLFDVAPGSATSTASSGPSLTPVSAGSSINDMRSPFIAPPQPPLMESPYVKQASLSSPASHQSLLANAALPYPPLPGLPTQQREMPDLSPALSDASSISPDPQSPEHDGFCWQPIVTVPRSEITESIIEQQRRPRQKRKSCLPDGVVEEYVGTTDVEGVFICLYPNCQRLFRRTYNLRSHIQTHLCDRPYICKMCDANFVRPHDLRRHERSHSTTKAYMCPCGKGFSRQDAMQRHRLREICEGAISSGIPKSPKPRGRPKGRKNTPTTSPTLDKIPEFPSQSPETSGNNRLDETGLDGSATLTSTPEDLTNPH